MDCGDCSAVERPCAAHQRERASSHLSQSGCRTLTTPLQRVSALFVSQLGRDDRVSPLRIPKHGADLLPLTQSTHGRPVSTSPAEPRHPSGESSRTMPPQLPLRPNGNSGPCWNCLSAGKRPIMGAVWSSLTFCYSCPLFCVRLLGCVASEHSEPVLQLHSSLCRNYSKFL